MLHSAKDTAIKHSLVETLLTEKTECIRVPKWQYIPYPNIWKRFIKHIIDYAWELGGTWECLMHWEMDWTEDGILGYQII